MSVVCKSKSGFDFNATVFKSNIRLMNSDLALDLRYFEKENLIWI